MTKTLTEQWREGTLEDGFYYILIDFFGKKEIRTEELFSGEFCTIPQEFVKEILDVVPPYVKFREIVRSSKESSKVKKLKEQLKEANAIINLYFPKDKKINAVCVKPINDYRKKWGVK